MTQALARVEYKPTELTTDRLGAVLVKSGFFQDTRDEAQAIVKILAGRELGFGPIASMQGVYIVKGRVTLSANLVGAAIQRSGKYGYDVVVLTNEKCQLNFYNRNPDPRAKTVGFVSVFTMEDAKLAGLTAPSRNGEPSNYARFARNMLFSRALTNGARWFCPEVFNGPIYTPDELGAEVDEEGAVIEELPGSQQFVPMRLREIDDRTGSDQPTEQPAREPEITPSGSRGPAVEAALEKWIEAAAWAAKHEIPHKELPAHAPINQIERWTAALNEKIETYEAKAVSEADDDDL